MAKLNWSAILDRTLGDFTVAALPPTLELPALPRAVAQYVQKSGDPNVELKDLAKIIETDSGLTTAVLKYVISSHLGLRSKAKMCNRRSHCLDDDSRKCILSQPPHKRPCVPGNRS
jgi:serine/threonine-protein kinase